MTTHYETPDALRHDAHAFAEDARSLIAATADIADEKVAGARRRLEAALANGKETLNHARESLEHARDRARDGIQSADECVRRYPYESAAVAFGVGTILGFLLNRRD